MKSSSSPKMFIRYRSRDETLDFIIGIGKTREEAIESEQYIACEYPVEVVP